MRGLICLKGVKFLPRMPRKNAPMPRTNFADLVYGEIGRNFAEYHHALPISDLAEARETRLSDLAIVCANCHPMLHRAKPWKTVQELKKLVRRDNPLRLRLHVRGKELL
jgi:hypothetical protein